MKPHPLKTIIYLVAMLLPFVASAQSDDEIRRAINEIKRSPDYFYAESTMEDESKAKDAANVFLATYINDYIKENKITGVERVKSDAIDGVLYKTMNRGTQIRVFAYVHRSVYVPNYVAPKKEGYDKYNGYIGYDYDNGSGGNNVGSIVKGEISAAGRRAVGELLTAGDLSTAVKRLAKLQSENIVKRYGTMRDCRNATGSYWIIAGSSMEIVTVLGPDTGVRQNFSTGNDDSLANYSGYNAVWFELN